jgi:hypothetical protein
MNQQQFYPIGVKGQIWGEKEKLQWRKVQKIQRSYQSEVLDKLTSLPNELQAEQYGELRYEEGSYPLFLIKSVSWQINKPTVLVTGGVHGYETSGVQGALRFAIQHATQFSDHFNFVIAPCISPWGYETINRWNPKAIDPNRSFYKDSPADESALLMAAIAKLNCKFIAHIDLHETTDTDNSEFRPALAARDNAVHDNWNIPDGFYLVGDTENPQPEFQQAVIKSVAKVTHIAPADDSGQLIGVPLSQWGVINYPTKALGLCAGFSNAQYCTTTEVYPDSPLVDDENCILAQVAAITGAITYIMNTSLSE